MFCGLRGPTNVSPASLARYSIALAILASPRAAAAQDPPASVTTVGRVIDVKGTPVVGAVVGTEDSSVHATTDAGGWFTLSTPIGTTLVIDHDGDETGLAVVTGATLEEIVLRPVEAGETIEMHGEKPVEAPGA